MMFRRCITCSVLTLGMTVSFCLGKLPPGVSFDEKNGLRLSPQIARLLNIETRGLDRHKYIRDYIAALDSPDPGDRAWAAYALGAFQDEVSLKALLERIAIETSGVVVDDIYNQLNGMFELYGFPASAPVKRLAISDARVRAHEWMEAYTRLGYMGLAERGWQTARKRGTEGVQFFIAQITARYDPRLTPLLLDVVSSPDAVATKDQVETTILCWSGYDLRIASPSDLKKELASPDVLSSDKICARYRDYFESIGYAIPNHTSREIGLAVLFGETDKKMSFRREMALRMISCQP